MQHRLTVTGFGPFPGMARNPSAEVARRVAASPRWRRLGVDARAVILTTTYAALEDELEPLLKENFDALLMIGVAGRAKRVRVERRADNRASILSPDAHGRRPARPTLGPGPSHRHVRGRAATIAACLGRRALPCSLSQHAGRYLCNAAYYSALAVDRPVLFLHIPRWSRTGKRAAPGAGPRRRTGPDRLADAFADVAVELLRQARLAPRTGTPQVAGPHHAG